MGGCSSKPETADQCEGHPPPSHHHTSPHTLQSLFIQHGRDGEDLLENAQTLHELLLHAVDSKSFSHFENLSAGNADAHSDTRDLQPDLCFSRKQNSPLSVISNLPAENAQKCIEVEGRMPNFAEENGETRSRSEGAISTLAEENADKCAQLGVLVSNLPEEYADKCAKLECAISNLAEEHTDKNAENCDKLEAESFSRGASIEPTSDLEPTSESDSSAESKIRGLDLEPKPEFLKISEPISCQCILTEAIKSSKAMEGEAAAVHSLDDKSTNSKEKTKVRAEKAMEGEEDKTKSVHGDKAMEGGLKEKAMEAEEKQMQREKAVQIDKDETSQEVKKAEVKNEKAIESELIEVQHGSGAKSLAQGGKAIECNKLQEEEMERAMECEKSELQAEKDLGGEKTGVQDEKAMDCERTGVQKETVFDDGESNVQEYGKGEMEGEKSVGIVKAGSVRGSQKGESQNGNKAGLQDKEIGMQDETFSYGEEANTVCVEKAGIVRDGKKAELQNEETIGVQDEKTGVQDEQSGVENENVGVQDDRIFDGEKAKAVCVEKAGTVQDCEKAELQDKKRTGVEDEETGVQREKIGVQGERIVDGETTKVQDEERAENERAMGNVSPSQMNQLFALTLQPTPAEHSRTETRCTERPMVATRCGPVFELASKENIIEAADLGLTEKLKSDQKKLACKENTVEVAVFGLTPTLESYQKKLASRENNVEAANSKLIEKLGAEQKHIEKKHGKREHEQILENAGDFEHSKPSQLDDERNTKTLSLAQSLVEAAFGLPEHNYQVDEEKKDDKFASHEALLTEGSGRDLIESSSIDFPSELVIEHDTSDDYDTKAKIDVSGDEKHAFVQKAQVEQAQFLQSSEEIEPQNDEHNQILINQLDPVLPKGIESEQSPQTQAYNVSALPPSAESAMHENPSCLRVTDHGVDKGFVDIKTSDLSAAKMSINESVESNPGQKTLGQDRGVEEKEIGAIDNDEVMAQIEA